MKQSEIQKCFFCDKGVCEGNIPYFYKFSIGTMILNLRAIKRQAGLEQFMGNARLAMVMGPNEDIANEMESRSGLLCASCAMQYPIAALMEKQEETPDCV